jgi:hypothetical protein
MSRFPRFPFLGSNVSDDDPETRSILDMMFIQGTSRLTIADIADSTPLDKISKIE